jgi:hypothetical protein
MFLCSTRRETVRVTAPDTALVIGMATSVIGMGCRYLAHLHPKREIRKAKDEAERR